MFAPPNQPSQGDQHSDPIAAAEFRPGVDATTVQHYLRVIYRRRRLAIAVFLAVVLSAAAYTFTISPVYEAEARIVIESSEPNVTGFARVLDSGVTDDYSTQEELLRSRTLAQRTVAEIGMAGRPGFPGEAAAVNAVLAGLRISPVRGTRMVNIRFRTYDPALAAAIANAHARAYINQNLHDHVLVSTQATQWLDGQLAEQRRRVQVAEDALQAYREEHDALSLKDGQGIVVQKLADLNTAVTRAKAERLEKEAEYQELLAVQNDPGSIASFPAVLSNPFIQQLKAGLVIQQREYAQLAESLGERHPTLIEKGSAVIAGQQRLAEEVGHVVESVRSSYRTVVAEEASLQNALEEQKREALSLNQRGIEYAALEREAESVRQIYQTLLQRAKEAGISRELQTTNIRVIDAARPPTSPMLPRTNYNLFIGALVGFLLALGSVFGAEVIDDRIKTPDDLRREVRVPFLGLVPEIRRKVRDAPSLLTESVPASFAEAVRALRTAVVSTSRTAAPTSILVASANDGEGKTLVAANLAIALAQAQQRVLLVDADMRRPGVHLLFGHAADPGLSDVLDGTAPLAEALRPTSQAGLTIFPAGTASDHASELLGSATFGELFETMQEHFAWVIVDSPPVLAVTDASIMARLTGGIIIVVGSGMTNPRAVRLALEELQRASGHVTGAVLNRADLEHHPFYFAPYSRGQYPAHAAGQHPTPESLLGRRG